MVVLVVVVVMLMFVIVFVAAVAVVAHLCFVLFFAVGHECSGCFLVKNLVAFGY